MSTGAGASHIFVQGSFAYVTGGQDDPILKVFDLAADYIQLLGAGDLKNNTLPTQSNTHVTNHLNVSGGLRADWGSGKDGPLACLAAPPVR